MWCSLPRGTSLPKVELQIRQYKHTSLKVPLTSVCSLCLSPLPAYLGTGRTCAPHSMCVQINARAQTRTRANTHTRTHARTNARAQTRTHARTHAAVHASFRGPVPTVPIRHYRHLPRGRAAAAARRRHDVPCLAAAACPCAAPPPPGLLHESGRGLGRCTHQGACVPDAGSNPCQRNDPAGPVPTDTANRFPCNRCLPAHSGPGPG